MSQLDLFYKAFYEYRRHTASNLECKRLKVNSASQNTLEQQNLTAVFTTCTIDEDWVEAIEFGLPYIVKAIKEERQFIRNDGEVTPIEKVRKTSKDSIVDLARHSNYISHEPDPNQNINVDVLPDKLLIIRKENDYTVYENRVIYATLMYLQEFVSFRLAKIKEATNKYEAKNKINKKIIMGNRTLNFNLDLDEIIKEDPIASRKNNAAQIIERIEIIYSNITSLLRMPLIVEVSKVDMVSRPITKTNVLKMDTNFKETLKLFDFIAEYEKPGFEINVVEKSFNPISVDIVNDYTEIMMLTSFVTYLHVNGLTAELHKNYLDEIERLKKLEEDKALEKIKKINIKANLEGKTLDEYLIILDEANKILQERNDKLNQKILNIDKEHKSEIENINTSHKEEIRQVKEQDRSEYLKLSDEKDKEISDITSNYEKQLSDLRNELESTKQSYENKITNLKEECANKVKETETQCTNKVNEIRKEKEIVQAELVSLKLEDGLDVDPIDWTDKENFESLERSKGYLDEFYKKAWKATKKSILRDVFSKSAKQSVNETEEAKQTQKNNKKNK